MESGYERHYMKIIAFDKNERKMAHGLACVNIDPTCKTGKRAFLRHLSVIRTELLPQAFHLITDFIWRRIDCDHIRFEQFQIPHPETGKLMADVYLKDALKEVKFRWMSLINDPVSGRRSQLMQLAKSSIGPDSLPAFENPHGL